MISKIFLGHFLINLTWSAPMAKQSLSYHGAESLKTLALMDLHRSRSLVMFRSCSVVTPPPTTSFILPKYFFLGLLLLPANRPVNTKFSKPSTFITWPRKNIYVLHMDANSSLLLPMLSIMSTLLLLSDFSPLNSQHASPAPYHIRVQSSFNLLVPIS